MKNAAFNALHELPVGTRVMDRDLLNRGVIRNVDTENRSVVIEWEHARIIEHRVGSDSTDARSIEPYDIGTFMKWWEGRRSVRFGRSEVILARLDGRSFSRWTADLQRPYDPAFSRLMVATAVALLEETNARCAYTQSDEITLVFQADLTKEGSQVWFDGRMQKMVSQLAALATGAFNLALPGELPAKAAARTLTSFPSFDARVWSVPHRQYALETILWRGLDAKRNSVQMAARAVFSHDEVNGKSVKEMKGMLAGRGKPWEIMPDTFRFGTLIQRRRTRERMTTADLEALPPKHEARRNPGMLVERSVNIIGALPNLWNGTNGEAVIFDGAIPLPLDPPPALSLNPAAGR